MDRNQKTLVVACAEGYDPKKCLIKIVIYSKVMGNMK